jgi:hypothetical protein
MCYCGWTDLSFSSIISDLDSHLKSERRKREALAGLLVNSRISQGTFDIMEKKLDHFTSVVSDLKEVLEREEFLWQSGLSEQKRILECLLMELELKRLLGEIREEEWKRKSMIINLGLNSLDDDKILTNKAMPEPAPPMRIPHEEQGREEVMTVTQRNDMPMRRVTKPANRLKSSPGSRARCMNPWKPKCKDTDIDLSIYYHDQMTPICHRCWEDLSKKNIEWSSL